MDIVESKPTFISVKNLTYLLLVWFCFLFFVLDISALQTTILLVIDLMMLLIAGKLLYPYIVSRFWDVACSREQPSYLELKKIPLVMAKHSTLVVFIAQIPVLLIVLFYLNYPYAFFLRVGIALLMIFALLIFFFLISHLSHSEIISSKIIEHHQRNSFADDLIDDRKRSMEFGRKFLNFEFISFALFCTCLAVIMLISVVYPYFGKFSELVVPFAGIVLIGRTLIVFRSFIFKRMHQLFVFFDDDKSSSDIQIIPANSFLLMGQLETLLNSLQEKMQRYKEEVFRWVLYETEYDSSKRINDLAALVAHDLMGPINAIVFCIDEFSENADSIADNRIYIEQLQKSATRLMGMIQSLRNTVTNSSIDGTSIFQEVHTDALNLLRMEFRKHGIHKINISFQTDEDETLVNISQTNLFHVLYNVYKNSITNLLENNISDPAVAIKLGKQKAGVIIITVTDNGTGLSSTQYAQFTEHVPVAGSSKERKGLGLRLCRRLVEFHQGALNVEEGRDTGTQMIITLALAD